MTSISMTMLRNSEELRWIIQVQNARRPLLSNFYLFAVLRHSMSCQEFSPSQERNLKFILSWRLSLPLQIFSIHVFTFTDSLPLTWEIIFSENQKECFWHKTRAHVTVEWSGSGMKKHIRCLVKRVLLNPKMMMETTEEENKILYLHGFLRISHLEARTWNADKLNQPRNFEHLSGLHANDFRLFWLRNCCDHFYSLFISSNVNLTCLWVFVEDRLKRRVTLCNP